MKAHKGDRIVCRCAPTAGYFARDIEDSAHISHLDFIITLPGGAHHDRGVVWICPTCDATVAQRFSGDRWRVRTRKGFIE